MALEPDQAAMLRFQAGDLQSFVELVHRHQAGVYAFCHRLTGDAHAADDLAQDVFLALYRSAASYRPAAPFRAFLFRIARNACINYLNRRKKVLPLPEPGEAGDPAREIQAAPEEGEPEVALLQQERARRVRVALAQLTERQRTALLLAHFHGLTYKEIAEVLGCPVGTVRSRLSAAYATLRRELADVDENPEAVHLRSEVRHD